MGKMYIKVMLLDCYFWIHWGVEGNFSQSDSFFDRLESFVGEL